MLDPIFFKNIFFEKKNYFNSSSNSTILNKFTYPFKNISKVWVIIVLGHFSISLWALSYSIEKIREARSGSPSFGREQQYLASATQL